MTDSLLTIEPKLVIGDSQQPLLLLVEDYENKSLAIPPFQRNYVWDNNKGRGWIDTLEKQSGIGVFVIYQLERGGTPFLADGYQRIETTRRYMKNPEEFGRSYGKDQARKNCRSLIVTVQKRIYQDHREALLAFQALNSGTSLTPFEYFKGILTIDDIGSYVYENSIRIVEASERILCRKLNSADRSRHHQFKRDCLGLFYQYASEFTGMTFWKVGTRNIEIANGSLLERLVFDHINGWSIVNTENVMTNFENYIDSLRVIIYDIVKKNGGKDMHPIIFRYLLHLGIWRKNTGRPVQKYIEFVERYISLFDKQKSIGGTLILEKDGETPWSLNTRLNDLKDVGRLCEYLEVDFYESKARKKNIRTLPGHHESHKLPFSQYGNGDTFAEPALINMGRGAKSVTP